MSMVKKIKQKIPLMVLIAALGVAAVIIVTMKKNDNKDKQARLVYTTESVMSKINANINNYLSMLDIWEPLLIQDDGKISDFEKVSTVLAYKFKGIRSIAIAPGDVPKYFFPKDQNDIVLQNLDTDKSFQKAFNTRPNKTIPSLNGPFTGKDNKKYFLLRNPLHVPAKTDRYWGYAGIIISSDAIFDGINLEGIEKHGYEFDLSVIDSTSINTVPFIKSKSQKFYDPQEFTIPILNQYWVLKIDQFLTHQRVYFTVKIIIAILLSAFASLLSSMLMNIRERNKELEKLTYIDELTGLSNSRKYQQTLDCLQKEGSPYGIIYLDLNNFKTVNDTYGHKTGNELLKIIANLLKNCVRDKDKPYRIGGDEFALIINGAQSEETYKAIIKRIENSIERTIIIGSLKITPGISAGYARISEDGGTSAEIERIAEKAMYAEKKRKKAERKFN